MLSTFLLLQRRWRENWELMQYSSFITKFTDTAHLRDQIQVWREILQKFPSEITRRRSWGGGTNLICSCGFLHPHQNLSHQIRVSGEFWLNNNNSNNKTTKTITIIIFLPKLEWNGQACLVCRHKPLYQYEALGKPWRRQKVGILSQLGGWGSDQIQTFYQRFSKPNLPWNWP